MSIFRSNRTRGALTPAERQLLEKVASYRDSYCRQLEHAAAVEGERRRANGDVCVAGCWVPAGEVVRVRNGLSMQRAIAALEAWVAVALTAAFAYCLWWLFKFLFLP